MTPAEIRTRTLLAQGKLVPLDPIREAFERLRADGLITQSSLARELGWTTPKSDFRNGLAPDTSRVMRALGLHREKAGSGRGHYVRRQTTSPDRAERMTLALAACTGLDPVDMGL